MIMEFKKFNKIARLNRDIVVTEKIDGTNAQICITEDGEFLVGSRTRWITPEMDNYGFARWAHENKDELMKLGVGNHYGEWWGSGCRRGYGLEKGEKRFSLINTGRWLDDEVRPKCCSVVPVLYNGIFSQGAIEGCLGKLKAQGSIASEGFMQPEGIVIFHTHGDYLFKVTIRNDAKHKYEL